LISKARKQNTKGRKKGVVAKKGIVLPKLVNHVLGKKENAP